MKIQLFEELKQITKDLVYSTEAEHPITPFFWKVSEKGDLTMDTLLQSEGFLQKAGIDQVFPQNLKTFQNNLSDQMHIEDLKQLELIEFLKSRCRSLDVYLVKKNDGTNTIDNEFEEFPLILAETETGEWIGIAPEVDTEFETRQNVERLVAGYNPQAEKRVWDYVSWDLKVIPPQNRADFYVRFDLESLLINSDVPLSPDSDNSIRVIDSLRRSHENIDDLLRQAAHQKEEISKITLSLAAEIKQYLVGMKLFTRQYYEPHWSVERFVMKTATSKESLVSCLVDAIGFARTCQFIRFSQDAEEYEEYGDGRYTILEPLDRFLEQNLSNLREYVVGCMSTFYLYDIGQNSDGDWIGVSTIACWT